MQSRTKKLVLTAILGALATLTFLIESLFPPLIIPGAKMGLANIFVLLALFILGKSYAFGVLLIKILLGSLFSSNVSAIIYSLPSGIIALLSEILLLFLLKRVSIVCISICGAVLSITLQNVVFCLITNTVEYLFYLPYLAVIGVLSGLIVGFACYLILKFTYFTKIIKGE